MAGRYSTLLWPEEIDFLTSPRRRDAMKKSEALDVNYLFDLLSAVAGLLAAISRAPGPTP
jgi:hypothetical protein